LNDKHLKQEYAELIEKWTGAEAVRQRVVDRLKTLDGPLALDNSIWEEWDEADEMAGSTRTAVRSFLAANEHSWRP
jgi:hypothetical protein